MSLAPGAALVVVLAAAPLLPGIANRVKSLLTGRRGAPVWQLYADLLRLARKGAVYSVTTSWIFQLAPTVLFGTTLVAAVLVPLDGRAAPVSFAGDFVAFASLLALGRFLLVLAALDTGSSFEGMGASREVTVASFTEPALFLCFAALAVATGEMTLSGSLGGPLAGTWPAGAPALVMVTGALFVVLLAESARVPVDDPATHLELTMIHEVMVLDHSGPDLGMILYAGALKFALLAAMVAGAVVPRGTLPAVASLGLLLLALILVAVVVGVVESVMARLRLGRIPQFVVTAAVLASFALVLLLQGES